MAGAAVVKKAGGPGFVDGLMGFLKEGYPEAWDQAMSGVVRPVDRAIADEASYVAGLSPVFGGAYGRNRQEVGNALHEAGGRAGIGEQLAAHLLELDPSGALLQRAAEGSRGYVEESMQRNPRLSEEQAAAHLLASKYSDQIDLSHLRGYDKAYGQPDVMYSEPGLAAQMALGNPVAAYAIPAAGVGLAAAGGMSLYEWLQAQQASAAAGGA